MTEGEKDAMARGLVLVLERVERVMAEQGMSVTTGCRSEPGRLVGVQYDEPVPVVRAGRLWSAERVVDVPTGGRL